MNPSELIQIGWAQAIKEWVSQKRKIESHLADVLVEFFELAFEPIPYPQRTYFGLHADRISLCLGNIFLAAVYRQHIYILVERGLSLPNFHFEPAKSTERYIPLSWVVAPVEAVAEITQTQGIWDSYARANLEILESPVSRINIPKNQVNKAKLSDIFSPTIGQVVEEFKPKLRDLKYEFEEGGIQEVTLELKKRNPQLREHAIEKYGTRCQVCGFSFERFYGELGRGYIEVHHLNPLSDYDTERKITTEEVTVVCANCHRVLHRKGKQPISIQELRDIVERRRDKPEECL